MFSIEAFNITIVLKRNKGRCTIVSAKRYVGGSFTL